MNDKKAIILQSAITLFAEKGFHLTSMQEIADKSGVAKGSVYTHFESKEELLISIFEQYYEIFSKRIQEIEEETIDPKQKFAKQLCFQFEEILKNKGFILMHMREQPFPTSETIQALFFQMKMETIQWYRKKIIELYGEDAKPYSFDASLLFSGILKEYLFFMIFEKFYTNLEQLVKFLLKRLDDIIMGLQRSDDHLFDEQLQGLFAEFNGSSFYDQIKVKLNQLIQNVHSLDMVDQDFLSSLEALKEELERTKPRMVVLKGLVQYIKNIQLAPILAGQFKELCVLINQKQKEK